MQAEAGKAGDDDEEDAAAGGVDSYGGGEAGGTVAAAEAEAEETVSVGERGCSGKTGCSVGSLAAHS